MKTLQLACVASLLCLTTPALAGEWEVLGTKVVGVGVDRDVITVGASEGRFVAVKLSVEDRGINLHDFKIHFANGDVKKVAVKEIIRKGTSTRVIDLPGNKRIIQKVTLLYNAVGRRRNPRRPKVTIHGKRGEGVVIAKPKPKPVVVKPKIEWTKLGERKVGFRVDKDTIAVTAANGLFHKIRLKVSDSPIRFRDLKIHFGNNTVLDVPVKKHFKPGDKTRIIDLPGKGRVIKKVVMWYDTKGFRGRATVTLWGGKRVGAVDVPQPVVKPTPTPAAGKWINLGNKKVAHRAEKDVIAVTAAEGRFRALKLKVKQRGVHLIRVKVVLGNGESHAKTFNTDIPAGGETPAFNLPGSKRVVKAVHLWYRTKGKPRGPRAWVSLLGKR